MQTRIVVVVITLVAGALAVVWLSRPGKSPSPAGAPRAERGPGLPPSRLASQGAAEPEAAPGDEEDALAAMVSEIEPVDGKLASVEKLRRTLAIYQEVSVYPPWSRPASEGSSPHLLRPNAPASMGQPFAADSAGRQIRTDVALDRWFIGPGETATATLTVTREDEPGVPYEPRAARLRVEYYDPQEKAWPTAADLPLVRRDDQLVAVVDPSAIPALAAADPPPEVRLVAHVESGAFFKDLPIIFRYATKHAFEVSNWAGDRVAGGSLEVDIDVRVHHLAPTLIQAVLYDGAGVHPVATFERSFLPEKTGPQTVTLEFFGKALRDAGVSGPFRLKGLHGLVQRPGAEPAELFWSHPDDPPIVTRAYAASQFSDAPWSSPDKERMVARYRELIEQGGI